ncbi:unnamed protein product [Clonostachys byssicola]|uniref:Up-regulated during septation protein 1 domain-containing protein n=1 Tax=Clonostachys byssicola TaxID=160290 RepID=A0A9N9XVJ6_9HYPO|nr:unnamed protein product [Clonostachys byssicola]
MAYPLDMATDDFSPPPRTGLEPNGNVVVDSYRQDIMNGFEQAAPAYNSMNPGRPQSSVMVDLKDPIQIHLLTETALSDSKEFEILSQEEIDGLKKLVQTLTKRIESTRSNLLIQAKYRDAANSMTKLYNPSNGDDPDQDHSMREAEEERRVTQQRCEDLAAELFYLEKRLMEPKSRLLEHTAGILQLTHKASKKKATANGQPLNGVPGSPESLYTYTQGRDSLYGPDGFYTDDTSFEEFERGNAKALNNPLEIPMKSPNREQQSQLKEELDRSRQENTYLMESISDMEKRLEDLNGSLRDTIIRFNPEHNAEFLPPPRSAAPNGSDPSEFLREQFDYLETALEAIEAEQQTLLDELHGNEFGIEKIGSSNVEATLKELWDMIHNGYTDIRKRQEDRRRARADKGLEDDEDISDDEGIDLSESYTLFGFSSRVRWLYRQATVLKDQKSVLKRQIKQQRELNNKSDAEKDAELAQKQEELDQSHILISRAEKDAMDAQQMLSEALEELEQVRDTSRGAGDAQAELQERAARTEALEAKLKELQQSLAESEADSQATQQRLAQVDSSITALSEALDDATEAAAQSHAKSEHLQQELRQKQEEIAKAQEMVAQAKQEIAQAQDEARQAQEEAEQAQEEAEKVHEELEKAQEEAEKAQEEAEKAQEEAEQAYNEAKQAQEEVKHKEEEMKKKDKALKEKEEEFDMLNMSYVELKTEVTIARAELDGAYGTRAERAADVAAVRVNGQIDKLEAQVKNLKSELAETVKELEEVTKETIGSEREKAELEGKLDEAISVRMALETDVSNLNERLDLELQKSADKLAQLQDELDGERLKASRGDASARPGAGATVLSEKFRATMREERKKFQEDMKEERSKIRKLEEELSKLKRAQGPGKSPLSPR